MQEGINAFISGVAEAAPPQALSHGSDDEGEARTHCRRTFAELLVSTRQSLNPQGCQLPSP